jgi:hypothetical protein
VLLGTAFAAKLWPVVLVPLFAVWLWRHDGRRALTSWAGAAVVTAAVWFVPFLVIAPDGVAHSFHRQLARPLQIESLGASVLVAAHQVIATRLGYEMSFGSQNLGGSGVRAVSIVTTAVEVLAIVSVWLLFARRAATVDRLLAASAAVVAALIVFGKVYSPQFGIWLIAFVPLVRSVAARALFLLALVLTQVYFPKRYWDYATNFHAAETGVVLLRNLAVLALFVLLLLRVRRRDPEPGLERGVERTRLVGSQPA